MIALPVRTEFGFDSTVCDCEYCTVNCYVIPGYLIPADLPRLFKHFQLDTEASQRSWAKRHLLASPGALVLKDGIPLRVPTIVPARRPGAACQFLDGSDKCSIHAVAPFGCRMVDAHMPVEEATRRSSEGIRSIMEDQRSYGPYTQLREYLHENGKRSPGPELARQRLAEKGAMLMDKIRRRRARERARTDAASATAKT